MFASARICSKHFADKAFTKPLQEHLLGYSPTRTRKIRDAIPTLHHAVPPLTSNENVLAETMAFPVSNEALMDVEQTPASSSAEGIMLSQMLVINYCSQQAQNIPSKQEPYMCQ